jgi:hypothetical protein
MVQVSTHYASVAHEIADTYMQENICKSLHLNIHTEKGVDCICVREYSNGHFYPKSKPFDNQLSHSTATNVVFLKTLCSG